MAFVTILSGCGSGGGGGGGGGNNSNLLSVTSVSPATGGTGGGTQVTISGTNFDLSSNMTVTFGGTPATAISVISSTSLQCTTPARTSIGPVDVTANILSPGSSATLAGGFTYATGGSMTISNVNPNQGPQSGGTIVTITGTNFANVTQVLFGGSAATISNASATTLVVTTTFHAPGAVDVVVNSSSNGTVTLSNGFTYLVSGGGGGSGSMTVTNVTPASGPLAGGNVITIDGTSFLSSITVTFAGRGGFNITVNGANTQITVTVPSAIVGFSGGPVNLTVSSTNSAAGSVSLTGYTYIGIGGAPVLASVTPNTAPESGGTKVTIAGSNFLQGTSSNIAAVFVGSKQLQNLTIVNATQLTGTLPPSVAGATTIVAFGTNGAQSNLLNFTYTPSLFITSLNPNQGPTAGGGRSVTVKGRNFGANFSGISFAGVVVPAAQVTVIDSSTLTVIPPASPLLSPGVPLTGPVDVTLVGTGIASGTIRSGYNYGPTFNPPSISSQPANQTGVATVGTILAVQFLASAPTGALVIQPARAFAYASLSNAANDILVATPAGTPNLVDAGAADVDGDGDVDVLLLNAGSSKQIIVCTNVNNTSFTTVPTTVTAAGTPVSMAIGLFNNDGFVDVVVSLRSPDEIQVFVGGAGGTLTPQTPIGLPAGSRPGQILCADPKKSTTDPKQVRDAHDDGKPQGLDMNGDGRADLIVALSGRDEVAVLTQSAVTPFSFSISSVASTGVGCVSPQTLALGDIDDSGTLDIVVGCGVTNNLSVMTGNGAGAIAFVASYGLLGPGNQTITGVVIGDFNRDCRQDIVTSNFNGQNISIYIGHGTGTFGDATNYDAEIASRRAGATIQSISYDPSFRDVYTLDVNVTSNTDFVTVVTRATTLFVQGQIVAPPYLVLAGQNDPQAIAFGDLNRDGHKDIIVANRAAGTLQVFVNDGVGNFSMPFAPIATGLQPESIVISDVNNDGLPDALVACNGSDAVFIHRNLGGGQLAAGTMVPVNARGPHQVVAVDMDGDSNIDFVTVNQYGNSVSCFVNLLGDGTFTAAVGFAAPGQPAGVYPVGNAPLGVAVADLNNDGRPEIVTANSNDDTVTVLTRAAAAGVVIAPGATVDFPLGGIIAPANSQPAGTAPVVIPVVEPVAIAIADLNRDGFLDIVTADKFTNTVTILHGGKATSGTNFYTPSVDYRHYGSSTAIGTPPVKLVTPANPVSVVLADMNDDGLLDVVAGCFGGASVVDFITQGAKLQSAATGAADLNLAPASADVVTGVGETAFVYDPKLFQILYKTGALVTFNGAVGSPLTSMAIGRLTQDCPPVVGTTSTDKNIRLFKVK